MFMMPNPKNGVPKIWNYSKARSINKYKDVPRTFVENVCVMDYQFFKARHKAKKFVSKTLKKYLDSFWFTKFKNN